jgi:hypothetical protein
MALTANEQELYDWMRAAIPRFFFAKTRSEEEINAFLKVFDASRQQVEDWFQETLISLSSGIWLTQHAIDRFSDRQDGESDAELRARLQIIQDAVTRSAILTTAQAIWDAAGLSGTVVMVELAKNRIYLNVNVADYDIGGTFVGPDASNVMRFTPDAGFAGRPYDSADVPPNRSEDHYLYIENATDAGNDGTYEITGFDDDAVLFTNAAGVARVDAVAEWRIERRDWQGVTIDGPAADPSPANGWEDGYLDRGFRISNTPPNSFVIILPYDVAAVEANRVSVEEGVRQKKAAGNLVIVERRSTP